MKACKNCKHGIADIDPNGVAYVLCAFMPPDPRYPMWRPTMKLMGWCGQFRFSLMSWLGYGARA